MFLSDIFLLQSQGEGRAAAAIENESGEHHQQQQQLQLQQQQQQQQRPLVDHSGESSRNNNVKANNNGTGTDWRTVMAADPSRFKSGIPTAFDPNHSRDSLNVTRSGSGIPTPGSAQPSGPPLRLVDYLRNDPSAHTSVPRPVSASRNNIS